MFNDILSPVLDDVMSAVLGSVFSPLSLSPALWLDSSDLSTITHVANAVSQWDDKSGNGWNATQGTGVDQPTTGTRTINSLNAIDFTDDRLDISSTFKTKFNAEHTMFIAFQSDDTQSVEPLFIGRSGGSATAGMLSNNFGSKRYLAKSATASASSTHNTNAFVMRGGYDGTDVFVYSNGVLVDTSPPGADATISNIGIGNIEFSASYYDGMIGEILFFDRTLTPTEITQVEGYLNSKWGV